MQNFFEFFSKIDFDLGQNQTKAILIAGLFFLAVVLFAYIRKYFVKSTLDGVLLGIFFGFLLTLLLEGFLLIAGKTAVTELLGWEKAPKPISTALDLGRERLKNVLGEEREIPISNAKDPVYEDAISVYQSLDPLEQQKVKKIICAP